jgi:hypothetical protein
MSTGSGIGGIFGAAAGIALAIAFPPSAGITLAYFAGAAGLGMTIGSAIGSYISPVNTDTPDSPALGKPDIEKSSYTTCAEGLLIPDVFGTTRLSGNIIGYWNPRNTPIIVESENQTASSGGKGGKGGGGSTTTTEQTTGYKYYLTWAVGLCEGPVDGLYAIYKDKDKCIWKGAALRSQAAQGCTVIIVTDLGAIRFYWGTDDQVKDPSILEYQGATYTPRYRNFCYAVFYDCYLGEYNRAPVIDFVIRKTPYITGWGASDLGNFDCSPAMIIYGLLNNQLQISSDYLDLPSFVVASSQLADEKFGISMLMNQYQSALTYLETILNHIDGIINFTPEGKFALTLIRADKYISEIPTIQEAHLLELPTFTRKSWLDTYNDLKIQYSMRINDPSNQYPDPLVLSGVTEISILGDYTYTASGGSPQYTFTVMGCASAQTSATSVILYVRTASDAIVTVQDSAGQVKILNVVWTETPPGPGGDLTIDCYTGETAPGFYGFTFTGGVFPCTWTISSYGSTPAYFSNNDQIIIVPDSLYVEVAYVPQYQSFLLSVQDSDGNFAQLWVGEV